MFFIALTFAVAFLIEGLGTYVSVIGLSTLFGANPIIIALAISLDMGKLVVVTLLYTYWNQLGTVMRGYALIASVITMTITSAGAAGYLSGEFQKAILGTQEGALKVEVLKGQILKYEDRKKQIDSQIASLPEKTSVNQRLHLMNAFKTEQTDLQAKISELDKQLPDLQIHQIGVEAKAGPILYVAKAFNIPVESAVKWVILMIISVFDLLAVFLIVSGNFLLRLRRGQTQSAPPPDIEQSADVKTSSALPIAVSTPANTSQIVLDADESASADKVIPADISTDQTPAPTPASSVSTLDNITVEDSRAREEITLSTLGLIKADPDTITDVRAGSGQGDDFEVGLGTGAFKTGAPKR